MNKHWETFQEVYRALDQKSKDCVDSDTIPNIAQSIIDKLSLEKSAKGAIIVVATNYLLKIILAEQLSAELIENEIAEDKIDLIAQELKSNITPLDKLTTEAKTSRSDSADTDNDLQQEIAETMESINQIQSVRTMQTDYQKQAPAPTQPPANTHSQTKPETQAQKPDETPQPRWASEA